MITAGRALVVVALGRQLIGTDQCLVFQQTHGGQETPAMRLMSREEAKSMFIIGISLDKLTILTSVMARIHAHGV